MKPMWMVRAGREGRRFEQFIERGLVDLGGESLGPLHPGLTRAEVLRLWQERLPGKSLSFGHQLHRFLAEVKVSDRVVTYDPEHRTYAVGTIVSDYEWEPGAVEGAPHIRRVEWSHRVPRDVLSAATRNTLGSIMTLFRLSDEAAAEIEAAASGSLQSPASHQPEESDERGEAHAEPLSDNDVGAEILEKADQFIEDRIARLSWSQMQHLVAGILRAMGYRTTVSEAGPDRGVDIFASPDGLYWPVES